MDHIEYSFPRYLSVALANAGKAGKWLSNGDVCVCVCVGRGKEQPTGELVAGRGQLTWSSG